MVVVVPEADAERSIRLLNEAGETAWRLGSVAAGGGEVEYV